MYGHITQRTISRSASPAFSKIKTQSAEQPCQGLRRKAAAPPYTNERVPGISRARLRSQQVIYTRVPETLPQDVLKLTHAPSKPDFPLAILSTLTAYDGFLLGIPTRFGSMQARNEAPKHL